MHGSEEITTSPAVACCWVTAREMGERPMRVTVKTVQGDSVQMELQPTTTVLETVRRAAVQVGMETDASSLVFRGRVLQGLELIGDTGIEDGSCIILARQRPRHAATASSPPLKFVSPPALVF